MLSDTDANLIFTQTRLDTQQTWWLAVVNPLDAAYDRACMYCGVLDSSHASVDLHTVWDNMEAALLTRDDSLSTTVRNFLHWCDAMHPPNAAASVAVCKFCLQWTTNHKNKHTTPLHALQYFIRNVEALPNMRSADLRILHKLCCVLTDKTQYGQINPLQTCFYREEIALMEEVAISDMQKMRELVAQHFMRMNIGSRYCRSKAAEFLRQHVD